jgi:hypothetical protein
MLQGQFEMLAPGYQCPGIVVEGIPESISGRLIIGKLDDPKIGGHFFQMIQYG